MNEDKINSIKDALREMMQLISQRTEPLTNDQKLKIAQVMEHAATRITQLRQEESSTEQPEANLNNNPSPDAQLLWILAGQQEEPFINYLNQYPSPATQSLLKNPSELQRTIEYLSRMMPQGEPPSINGIKHADLNSSNIWGTAYNPKSGQMKVRFQGGAEYEYDGVPPNIYRAFSKGQASAKTKGSNDYGSWWVGKNPSLGAAMNQYIKAGNFPYRRTN